MSSKTNLEQSMSEESLAATYYRNRAKYARSQGDEVTARLFEHIAEEEDGHYNEFKDRLNSLYEEGYTDLERLTPPGAFLEIKVSGVYVTVTEPGDTYWEIGQIVTAEEFDRKNKTMKALGKRIAWGEYHY